MATGTNAFGTAGGADRELSLGVVAGRVPRRTINGYVFADGSGSAFNGNFNNMDKVPLATPQTAS
jgi:hypothetical protein